MRASHWWTTWLIVPATLALGWTALGLPARAYTGFVLHGDRIEEVEPGSPAARAGLLAGDRLLPRQPGAPAAATGGALLAGLEPGEPVTWNVERGRQRLTLWLVPTPPPLPERRLFVLDLVVACGFLLLATLVWGQRRDALTRSFFLLSVAFSILVAPLPQWSDARSAVLYESLYAGISLFLPALFIHFFALFPEGLRPAGRLGAGVAAGYSAASLLFAVTLASLLLPSEWLAATAPALRLFESASAIWFAAGLLGSIALFARSFRAAGTADARRRLRVALLGTLLGVTPLAAVIVVRNLSPGTAVPGERVAVPLTLFVPAAFAWAIVVHRLFDVRVALRAAAAAGALVLGGILTVIAADSLASRFGHFPGDRVTTFALLGMTLGAALAGRVSGALRPRGAVLAPSAIDSGPAARNGGRVRSATRESLLAGACASLVAELRLDGCAAIALGESGPRVLARVGAIAPDRLSDRMAGGLPPEGRIAPLDELAFESADHEALASAGVRWVLSIGDPGRCALLLGRRLAGSWLGRHEMRDLEQFAAHLEMALENLTLRHQASSSVAFDRELREAQAIQAHLLPRRVPAFPTLDCAAAAFSSEPVGGDTYDFVETGARHFTLAVGDAAGKGVPAALLLAGVQARFRSEARRGLGPSALLAALNRQLLQHEQPEKFVGLLCAHVDVRRARIGFANAGLTPPLVRRRDGRFEELTEGGVLLGVRADASYRDDWVELGAGDVAILYTDGLTEARCGEEMFGLDRVQEVLAAHAGRRSADILTALIASVRAFADGPLDDVTVVVLRQLTDPVAPRVRAA